MRTVAILVTFPLLLLAPALLAAGCGDGGHPDGIGNACVEDADCPTNTCYKGPGGGYCTAVCQDEGSTDQCPVDTVCKPIQGGPARCLLVCDGERSCPPDTTCDADGCPRGSSCTQVSNTSLRACEPNP